MNPIPRPTTTLVAAITLAITAVAQESKAVIDAPLVVSSYYRLGTVLDLDGDGWQDSLGWWWNSSSTQSITVRPYMNDQQGGFTLGGYLNYVVGNGAGPSGWISLRKCDIDHDGRDDFSCLATPNQMSGGSSFRGFASNGAAAPRQVPTYSFGGTGSARMSGVIEDLDGDGTADAVVASGATLSVYSYTPVAGGDALGTLRATLALPASTDDMFVIDANADGQRDVFVNMGGVGWIVPIVDFQPLSPIVVAHGIATMPMPVAGDIDGDGDQDLVVFDMSSYRVMRRTGRANWSLEPAVAGGPATHLCDVDGDGDLDGVCCGGGGGPSIPQNHEASTYRVSLNDGTGHFAAAFEMPGLGSDRIAGAADLDHDGDIDLVAGRCVYYARGPITGPIVPSLANANEERVHACDIDADGDPDFRFVYGSVRRNLGTGECDSFVPLCPAPPPGTLNQGPGYSGDFDGDGDVDLIVQRWSGPTLLGARLYTNNGGGGFVDAGPCGNPGDDFGYAWPQMHPDRCAVADIDADGDLDLIIRESTTPTHTSVRLNDGAGRFFTPAITVMGCYGTNVADLNGDGVLDLLNSRGSLSIYWGVGDGTFGGPTALGLTAVSFPAEGLDIGDLDGDGDLDILVAAMNSNTSRQAEILWNLGAGAFLREEVMGSYMDFYPGNTAANVVDLNEDGLQDFVCGPVAGAWSAAYVFLRRADNSGFEAPIQQAIYPLSSINRTVVHQATVIDVDSDGDLDLVTDRVLKNTRWHGPARGKRVQATDATLGSGDMQPTLGVTGPFQVGANVTLHLTGAAPNATALLSVGWVDTQAPSFGGRGGHQVIHPMRLHSTLAFTTSGALGVDGSGEWELSYLVPGYKAGRTYVYFATIDDPGAPLGVSRSNSLRITYGL